MGKNKNALPPIDTMLYEDVHSFVNYKASNYSNHDKKVLEQKLIFIIDALAILVYGSPIFYTKFVAKKRVM